MQQIDPAKIERNVLKMKNMGASDDEIRAYLDEEDAKAAGSTPAKKNTPKPLPNEEVVTAPQGGFLTGDAPAPDPLAGDKPETKPTFNEAEEAEIQAYLEDNKDNLTVEGLQEYVKTISGGKLAFANPQLAIDTFLKEGRIWPTYPDAATKNEGYEKTVEKERFNNLSTFGMEALDALPFNFGTEIRAGADTLLTETLNPTSNNFGNFWNPWKGKYAEYSATAEQRAKEDPLSAMTGNFAGSIATPTGRIGIRNPGWKGGLVEGGVMGGLSGLGAGEGSVYERLDEAGKGAVLGAAGGATVGAVASRATPSRRADVWVDKVLKKDGDNPALPHLPEVAEDLFTVANGTVKFNKATPKGRAEVTVKQINDLEDRYLSDIAGRLDKLPNLEPAQRQYLKEAIRGKHSLDGLNVDLLRGTPEGDFVADAIIRTQTLRAATPEVPRAAALPFAREVGALMSGGGVFALDGGLASLPAYAVTRYALSRMGNTEAARVNSAENLVSNIERYRRLGEKVGPSTYQGNRDLFMRMSDEAINEPWLAKKAKEAEAAAEKAAKEEAQQGLYGRQVPKSERVKPESPSERKRWKSEMDARMYPAEEMYQRAENSDLSRELSGMADEELAAMRGVYDDVKGANAELNQLYKDIKTKSGQKTEGQKALDKLEGERKKAGKNALDLIAKYRKTAMSPDEFMTKLDQPPEGAKVKEPKPYTRSPSATIKFNNIDKGLTGSSRVQATYADMVGVPEADMLRALDVVAKDPDIAGNPKLLDDITLIKNKYTTETKKGLSELLVPRMKAVLEQDGTMAKVKAQAEQAQAKTSARLKLANPNAETTTAVPQSTPTRAAEGDMVGISRPEQWEAGARNFQAQANASISKLDSMASEKAMTAYGNAPEVIRDSFRTTEEAVEYIKEVVMPELEIAGVDPTEIANIRSYLYEVAAAKRYPTREAYEAGTKKK